MSSPLERHSLIALASLLLLPAALAQPGGPHRGLVDADDGVDPPTVFAPDPATRAYSPHAGRHLTTRVYFGDTHLHTSNSGDAFLAGDRLGPEQAYRLARGEEVVSSTGVPVRLSRPLDFLVISDHGEGLGLMEEVYAGNPAFQGEPLLDRWARMMRGGMAESAKAANEVIVAQANNSLPPLLKDPKVVGPVMRTVWNRYTALAEKYNEPGRFTALIGYEWTSVPGGNNLHRNVIFRDGKARADQVFPFTSWHSEDPEKLWAWMERYEQRTGGRLLAIPHNGNLSNGRMFELVDFSGAPLTADYARRRARWEPLQEIIQTKGNSETHPTLSPNDEFAGDLGIAGWEYGNLTLQGSPETPEMRPFMYLRGGLLQGLKQQQKLGVNPFKFGFVGGSDIHNSIVSFEEDNFFGKHVNQEPRPERWKHISKQGFGKTRFTWHYEAAGYAAVWATANTREAIWDAMKRRETYGTSGTRMTVRFFGGWQFAPGDERSRQLADIGYRKGVPMGGDLKATGRAGQAPSFLVAALKDPIGANLDRIQIVKGWVDGQGRTQEKVFNVVWAGDRRLDGAGRLGPVGDTVDVGTATWTNTIGASELRAVWRDPEFNPGQRAFYYARVIEIPTPRWTAYDAVRFGLKLPPEVPLKQQERAWTSPIWIEPA
ncbi:MAG: hypothetical protein RLZZ609_2777 [Cyanobacteriota bacterium]|jgi:hypothetical protein